MKTQIMIIAILVLAAGCTQKIPLNDVKTFDDCASSGYPTDGYPRVCKTPDGRTFTSEADVFDTTMDYTCIEDNDCQMVNKLNGFSCCWKGYCDKKDYSSGPWIPVNKDWYNRQKTQICTKDAVCGPSPNCTIQEPTGDYKTACVNSKCMKIPVT